MRILILCRIKQAAGVATIVQKFMTGFDSLGHEVLFLQLDSDLDFLGEARNVIEVVPLKNILSKKTTYDVAFCIAEEFVWYSLFLRRVLRNRAKVFATVIHPRHYCYMLDDGSHPAEVELVRSKLLDSDNGLIFMNEQCRRLHEEFYGREIAQSIVLPLPVVASRPLSERHYVPGKIVSVGRLVNFKNHHESLILELIPLVKAGATLQYWIYGYGPNQAALEQFIESSGAASFCFFKGKFPYSEFENIMRDAWIFVGMGTSAIEAASLGIPTLIPVESRADAVTYGFFGVDYSGLEVGEAVPGMSEKKITDQIIAIQKCSPHEYENISKRTGSIGPRFEIGHVCEQYIKAFGRFTGVKAELSLPEAYRYIKSRLKRRYRTHKDTLHI